MKKLIQSLNKIVSKIKSKSYLNLEFYYVLVIIQNNIKYSCQFHTNKNYIRLKFKDSNPYLRNYFFYINQFSVLTINTWVFFQNLRLLAFSKDIQLSFGIFWLNHLQEINCSYLNKIVQLCSFRQNQNFLEYLNFNQNFLKVKVLDLILPEFLRINHLCTKIQSLNVFHLIIIEVNCYYFYLIIKLVVQIQHIHKKAYLQKINSQESINSIFVSIKSSIYYYSQTKENLISFISQMIIPKILYQYFWLFNQENEVGFCFENLKQHYAVIFSLIQLIHISLDFRLTKFRWLNLTQFSYAHFEQVSLSLIVVEISCIFVMFYGQSCFF
ncbi:unnamed protein product (macronuclear) [Paramecium tetraurelia]|uniref:Transmembrane protein n=1 Tax=Paramecium tetraurelia TaxID=5888 RepID=A0BTQ4_PARTE|nr:uncharacterized protein GSPATT00032153001 [Paramecium tetraurelia]CAK61921.1 unnamed protein product [Paramecium tetraurelia]|eukprot:XP_001429319.1 hypothetical protein (macronuclear) [Paramecium tetraurelia strain d4-2]